MTQPDGPARPRPNNLGLLQKMKTAYDCEIGQVPNMETQNERPFPKQSIGGGLIMSGKSISFKRGDTFQLEGTRTNRSGAAVDLSGLTISSQARVGSFVDDLTVSITSAATGEFILSATAAETELWPLGNQTVLIRLVPHSNVCYR